MAEFCIDHYLNPMKKPILLLLSLLPGAVEAQNECDSLVIDGIQYNAVDTGIIDVMAHVTNFDCIDYPSFILYDQNGDTLAAEVTDFFCLGFGAPQTHRLVIRPGVQLSNVPFDATLELFTGFGDDLVCSWNFQSLALCPLPACIQAEIYLTNTGAPFSFPAYWWITDDSGTWYDDGHFDMDSVLSTGFDTLCLPPGKYMLSFTPFSPIDTSYIIGITPSYQQSTGTNTHLHPGPGPLDLSFMWYAQCVDGTNGVPELDHNALQIQQRAGQLEVWTNDGSALGTIELFTLDGRTVRSLTTRDDRSTLPIADLSNQIILLRAMSPSGTAFAQRIFIP